MTAKEYILMNGGAWPDELPADEQGVALSVADAVEKQERTENEYVVNFRAQRPWLSICEECPELEYRRQLGGRCKVLYAMDKYKGCGCGGRVENIIGHMETRCPLGKFEVGT